MLDVLLPTACPACGRRGPAPCDACWRALKPAPPAPPPDGLDSCRSLLLYEGAGREMIARLKYRNARAGLAWLAAGMAALVRDTIVPDSIVPDTIVTWAPTTPQRRRERGFDQAELLARRVARELGLPAVGALSRHRGPPQTGRPAAERIEAVAFATTSRILRRAPAAVLLVDDVITTGATMSAAALVLRTACTAPRTTAVFGVTAARTTLKLAKGSVDA